MHLRDLKACFAAIWDPVPVEEEGNMDHSKTRNFKASLARLEEEAKGLEQAALAPKAELPKLVNHLVERMR